MYDKLCRYVSVVYAQVWLKWCVVFLTEDSTPGRWDKMAARSSPFEALIIPYGIAWGNIKARSPSISLTFPPERLPSKCPPALAKEKKACIASTDDVTLDNFIDRIRRCAISRIIEIRWLLIWSAAGGECCA